MKYLSIIAALAFMLGACTEGSKQADSKEAKTDTLKKPEYDYPPTEKLFYKTGELLANGKIVNGKRHGLWSSWFQDGKIQSELNFKNGLKDGINRVWYQNGQERIIGQYKNDQEIGMWYFLGEKGDTLTVVDFDKKNATK